MGIKRSHSWARTICEWLGAGSERPTAPLRLTVRRKIGLAFLVTATLTVGFGTYAVHNIGVTGGLMTATFDQVLISLDYARAASADFAALQQAMVRQQVSGITAEPSVETLAVQVQDDLRIAGERALSVDARRAAVAADGALAAWMAVRPSGAGPVQWNTLDAQAAVMNESLDQLVNIASGDGFLHRQSARALIWQSRLVISAATVVLVLLAALVSTLLSRQIMEPLRAASAAARRIAAGEWAARIPDHLTQSQDELGALLAAMETMRSAIEGSMMREVAMRRVAQVRLIDAIGMLREGVLVLDAGGAVVVANPRLVTLFPSIANGIAGAVLPALLEQEPLLAATGEVRLSSGTWVRISRSEAQDGGAIAIFSDITTLKQREAELQSTNECFDAALTNMSQGLALFDAQDRLRVGNPQFAAMYGLDPHLLNPGTPYAAILSAKVRGGFLSQTDAAAHAALRQGNQGGAFLHCLANGRSISISHEPLPGGGWVRTYEDVSERRRAEAQVTYLARHDMATGLPNRLVLAERIEQATATANRAPGTGYAVLLIGLHDFKIVSDIFGYAAADDVLRRVAGRLQGAVREVDTAARLATDEFAILQAGVRSPDEAGELAVRLLEAMDAPFEVEGRQVKIRISVGLALAPVDGDEADSLLRHADLALQRAWAEGNTFRFFETGMDERLHHRRQMQQDLHQALARNEFVLHYQPCIDLAANRVCGFEALLRWHHPERGMISPADFIPVAEASGLIVGIGEWVIRHACAEAVGWPAGIRIAVNVSPLQFASTALVGCVQSALAESGLAAVRLELEVTETALLRDDGATLATLHRIRALGVRVAMDDFGTGYSSLSYLRSFPFDKIKVDQSFVRGLDDAPGSAAIIRAIAGLGVTLGMRTTAEGVETADQLEAVRSAGCNEIQGFFFSRPVPGGQVHGVIDSILARLYVGAQPAVPLRVLAALE